MDTPDRLKTNCQKDEMARQTNVCYDQVDRQTAADGQMNRQTAGQREHADIHSYQTTVTKTTQQLGLAAIPSNPPNQQQYD